MNVLIKNVLKRFTRINLYNVQNTWTVLDGIIRRMRVYSVLQVDNIPYGFLCLACSVYIELTHCWRHSQVDHQLANLLSAVILEWTLFDVMFCVILFGDVLSLFYILWSHTLDPAHTAHPPVKSSITVFVSVQVNERGGAREEREEQRKQNGGLHEDEAPKQHRKPERTLRYRHNDTSRVTTCFSRLSTV